MMMITDKMHALIKLAKMHDLIKNYFLFYQIAQELVFSLNNYDYSIFVILFFPHLFYNISKLTVF